jgi:transcriptional regulator with PAS, ATPase and Fis domain
MVCLPGRSAVCKGELPGDSRDAAGKRTVRLRKGAFTGAVGSKPGRVELAHRGTLFLDEISELDPSLQSKLLQLLQDGQFCRIGAQEDKKVEVRVVCATNRNLEAEIEAGTFRQDLYYRINVVNLRMPALRERRGDIEDLCAYFLEYYNRKFNCRARPFSTKCWRCCRNITGRATSANWKT